MKCLLLYLIVEVDEIPVKYLYTMFLYYRCFVEDSAQQQKFGHHLACLCKFDVQKLKIQLRNRDNRIQHVQNVLKRQVFGLYPKMPLEVL